MNLVQDHLLCGHCSVCRVLHPQILRLHDPAPHRLEVSGNTRRRLQKAFAVPRIDVCQPQAVALAPKAAGLHFTGRRCQIPHRQKLCRRLTAPRACTAVVAQIPSVWDRWPTGRRQSSLHHRSARNGPLSASSCTLSTLGPGLWSRFTNLWSPRAHQVQIYWLRPGSGDSVPRHPTPPFAPNREPTPFASSLRIMTLALACGLLCSRTLPTVWEKLLGTVPPARRNVSLSDVLDLQAKPGSSLFGTGPLDGQAPDTTAFFSTMYIVILVNGVFILHQGV